MKPITVKLPGRSYGIQFGSIGSGLGPAIRKLGFSPSTKVLVVSSPNVDRSGPVKKVWRSLKASGFDVTVKIISDRESRKNHQNLLGLYKTALSAGLDRLSLVVAVGGGVITDVAGFFAATYMRGISYVSLPTTLLGMVDASIGGKTAVDLAEGKNLVGAFWQPRLVWMDPAVLATLPDRDWKTGMAEVVKYGVIRDRHFFEWLEEKIRRRPDVRRWPRPDLDHVISTCARIKAEVVSRDEKETPLKGGREILNFGHTIGHALEAATGYETLTHGEAISIGMVAAGHLALHQGLWDYDSQLRLVSMLEVLGLPVHMEPMNRRQWDLFWTALRSDKKHVGVQIRFVLPERLGRVVMKAGISPLAIKQVLSV